MKDRKKRKTITIIAIVFMTIFIAIGYSLLRTQLTINGIGRLDGIFKVSIKDARAEEHKNGKNISLSYDEKNIRFQVTLERPYDYVDYIFKVENLGNIDATLKSIDDSLMPESEYIKWNLVALNDDNSENSNFIGSVLKTNEHQYFKLRVYFEESILKLPNQPITLNMSLTMNYTQ